MLRVAVPNKGSLSEAASGMLAEAGYRQRRDSRELVMVDPDNEIEFFYLRPATSRSTSAPAPWMWESPAATCSWTPRSRPTN